MVKGRVCKICGCTNETPCITPEGPCAWIMTNLCTACFVEIPAGEHIYIKDKCSLLIVKSCKNCALLEHDRAATHLGYENYHHCTEGRFDPTLPDGSKVPGSYAWSGIAGPNKAVARAQARCPFFQVHDRFKKR